MDVVAVSGNAETYLKPECIPPREGACGDSGGMTNINSTCRVCSSAPPEGWWDWSHGAGVKSRRTGRNHQIGRQRVDCSGPSSGRGLLDSVCAKRHRRLDRRPTADDQQQTTDQRTGAALQYIGTVLSVVGDAILTTPSSIWRNPVICLPPPPMVLRPAPVPARRTISSRQHPTS